MERGAVQDVAPLAAAAVGLDVERFAREHPGCREVVVCLLARLFKCLELAVEVGGELTFDVDNPGIHVLAHQGDLCRIDGAGSHLEPPLYGGMWCGMTVRNNSLAARSVCQSAGAC